jgi:transcriptional regulator with XRE-family HTH domain
LDFINCFNGTLDDCPFVQYTSIYQLTFIKHIREVTGDMSKRPSMELRRDREQVIEPLFEYMEQRGMLRAWLARQLGISTALLWNYEHGLTRLPPDFIRRACKIVGFSARRIKVPKPRERYIQQPRAAKTQPAVQQREPTDTTDGDTDSGASGTSGASRHSGRSHHTGNAERSGHTERHVALPSHTDGVLDGGLGLLGEI